MPLLTLQVFVLKHLFLFGYLTSTSVTFGDPEITASCTSQLHKVNVCWGKEGVLLGLGEWLERSEKWSSPSFNKSLYFQSYPMCSPCCSTDNSNSWTIHWCLRRDMTFFLWRHFSIGFVCNAMSVIMYPSTFLLPKNFLASLIHCVFFSFSSVYVLLKN